MEGLEEFCSHRMTKELRESLVKQAKVHAEKAKVGIRKVRQKGISEARRSKDSVSKDTIHRVENHVRQFRFLSDESCAKYILIFALRFNNCVMIISKLLTSY